MIENLRNKIKDDKYHKSIRYFSHFLSTENRFKYISEVAKYNVYLAAQCIMSCEENNNLENKLATVALNKINSSIVEEKANGFLALIELNRFDLIHDEISQIYKIESIHRYTISQIFKELEEEDIIKFLKIVLKAEVKGLLNSITYNVLNRNINFSTSQRIELEELYYQFIKLYRPNDLKTLKFIFAFKLSKSIIPKDINSIAKKFVTQYSGQEFMRNFYDFYDIPFPFSNIDLCNLCLNSRNRRSKIITFSKAFFDIPCLDSQLQLLEKALLKGKYFAGFVISLVDNINIRENILQSCPENIKKISDQLLRLEHPEFDQEKLLEIIIKNKNKINHP